MKKLIGLLLMAAACSPAKKENQQTESASEPVESAPLLTDAQKAEGWKLLFDGKSLTGWQIFKARKNNTWEVKDGVLHCKPLNENTTGDGDERSDLMTADEFENFELAFDWKIPPRGNSGVIYLVTEEFEQPYFSGPEYQLTDDIGYTPAHTETQLTGTVYGMYTTAPKTQNAFGALNSSNLVVNRKHVDHWLNGQKFVEYAIGSADWQKRKNESYCKDA